MKSSRDSKTATIDAAITNTIIDKVYMFRTIMMCLCRTTCHELAMHLWITALWDESPESQENCSLSEETPLYSAHRRADCFSVTWAGCHLSSHRLWFVTKSLNG